MKALVTGANGFLGSWLTKRLMAEGHDVQILIRKNSDLSELKSVKPRLLYGDVTDIQSLRTAIKDQDVVFHLAGLVSYKKTDRALMEKVNVFGTQNVVSVCEEFKTPRLLYVSSVVAIGSSFKPEVLNEDSQYKISHLNLGYFETKKRAEQIVRLAAKENKIQAVCVNPSTIYGFGDAKKGSRKTQVKVARHKFPFYTSGGVNIVAVEDVIEGILAAYKKGVNGERYILANENMTIKTLFSKISEFADVSPPALYMPNWLLHTLGTSGDFLEKYGVNIGVSRDNSYTATMFHWFDSSKAQREIGFRPSSSDRAIENSVRWMKDNGYLK